MDRKFLENLGIQKENINIILNQAGKDLEKLKKNSNQYNNKNSSANNLTKTNEKNINRDNLPISKLDTNEEYEFKINELENQLKSQNIAQKLNSILNNLEFTSESAKNAFSSSMEKELLNLNEDSLLEEDRNNFEEENIQKFIEQYKKNDPNAFLSEKEKRKPIFSTPSNGIKDKKNTALRAALGLKNNY